MTVATVSGNSRAFHDERVSSYKVPVDAPTKGRTIRTRVGHSNLVSL